MAGGAHLLVLARECPTVRHLPFVRPRAVRTAPPTVMEILNLSSEFRSRVRGIVPKEQGHSLYVLFYALLAQALASLGADSAIPGLNRNLADMSKQQGPSAPIPDAFDAITRPLFAQVHYLGEQSRTFTALRDTPKLISGERRVKDAERFVEKTV